MREMKDSGIPWLGEIPKDWEVLKVKNIATRKCDKNMPNEQVLSLYRELGIVIKSERDDNHNVTSENTDNYKFVERNNLVVNKMKVWQGSIAVSAYQGIVSPAYYVYKFKDNTIYPWFVHYVLRCKAYLPEYKRLSGGIRLGQWDLSDYNFKNIPLPVPAFYDEQKRIADYLDTKCSKIDTIIEKQKAIIEKLKEYKSSVITEAVTKGFAVNQKMKKSGVEWVGKIPDTWTSIKLKYCTYIRARLGWKGLKAEEYVEEGYPLLSAFNIVNSKLNFENNINYINQYRYDESPEIMLNIGDILLVKDGAGIGKCAIIEDLPLPSTTNGSIAVITTDKKMNSQYLYYYFLSSMFQNYIDRLKDGMGVPHLFQSDLKEIEVVIPTILEQQKIVELLDGKVYAVDCNIAKKEQLIEKLQEYKKSLIYEVVTGKKEV